MSAAANTISDQEKRERSVQLFLSVHAMRRGNMNAYTEAHLVRTTDVERYGTNGLEAEDAAFNMKHRQQFMSRVGRMGAAAGMNPSVYDRFDQEEDLMVVDEDDDEVSEDSDALLDAAMDEIEEEDADESATANKTTTDATALFAPVAGPATQDTTLARRALLLGLRTPPPIASDQEVHIHAKNEALAKYVETESAFINEFGKLWDESKVARMRRRLFETAEDFFDPSHPQSMVSFVALGGLDMFCRLICLNPYWASQEAQNIVTGARRLVTANNSKIFGGGNRASATAPNLLSRVMAGASNTRGADGKSLTMEDLRRPYLREDTDGLTEDLILKNFSGSASDASVTGGLRTTSTLGGAFGLGPAAAAIAAHTDAEGDGSAACLSLDEEGAVDPFGSTPEFNFPAVADLGMNALQQNAFVANTTILATIIRIITEAIVCSSHMGWFLFDWRRGALVRRLLSLARIASIREGAFILVEHLLSIVGPALNIGSMPEFAAVVNDAIQGSLYALANVRHLPNVSAAIDSLKQEHAELKRAQRMQAKLSEKMMLSDADAKALAQQCAVKEQNSLANLRSAIHDLLETNNTDTKLPLHLQAYLLQQELLLASACRVISLSVVAGVMSDDRSNNYYFDDGSVNVGVSKRHEPYPQCLARIESMDNAVSENVDFLLHTPKFVPLLLRLIAKKDEKTAMRIFRGNRTMTVVADDQGNIALPTVGGAGIQGAQIQTQARVLTGAEAEAANAAAAAAGGQTFTLPSGVQVTVATQNGAAAAGGAAAPAANNAAAAAAQQQQQAMMQAMQQEAFMDDDGEYYDEEYEEGEEYDDFGMGGMGGGGAQDAATNQLFAALSQANANGGDSMAAIQQFVTMLMAGGGGGNPADMNQLAGLLQQLQQQQQPAAQQQQQPQQQGAAGAGAAGAPQQQQQQVDPQEALRQAAQGMGNEMPDSNAMDSIDLDWFVGNPNSQSRWRMGNMVIRGDGDFTASCNVRPLAITNAIVGARRAKLLLEGYSNGGLVSIGTCPKTRRSINMPLSTLVGLAYVYAKDNGLRAAAATAAPPSPTASSSNNNNNVAAAHCASEIWSDCQKLITTLCNYFYIYDGTNNNNNGSIARDHQRQMQLRGLNVAKFARSLSHIDNVHEDMHAYYECRDPSSAKRSSDAFVTVMEEAEFVTKSQATFHAFEAQAAIDRGVTGMVQSSHNNTVRQHIRKLRYDHQQIIGCQSEIYFVVSSLLMTQNYTLAHTAMTHCNLLPILNRMFGHVFFTETASNTIHYPSTTTTNNGGGGGGGNGASGGAPSVSDKNASPKKDEHDDDDDETNLGALSPNRKLLTGGAAGSPFKTSNNNDSDADDAAGSDDDDADKKKKKDAAADADAEADSSALVEVKRVVKIDNGILFEAPKRTKKTTAAADIPTTVAAAAAAANDDESAGDAAYAAVLAAEPEMFLEDIVTRHPMTELKTFMVPRKDTVKRKKGNKKSTTDSNSNADAVNGRGDQKSDEDGTPATPTSVPDLASTPDVGTTTTPPPEAAPSSTAGESSTALGDDEEDEDVLVEDDEDFASNRLGEDDEGYVFKAEDNEYDDEDDSHHHDPDTLRKLELARVVHEYWNAQDRSEVLRLLTPAANGAHTISTPAAVRPSAAAAADSSSAATASSASSSSVPPMDAIAEFDALALKLADRIIVAEEDPCVETTALHALEAYTRVMCFDSLSQWALDGDVSKKKVGEDEETQHLVGGANTNNDDDCDDAFDGSSSSASSPNNKGGVQGRLMGLKNLVEQRIWPRTKENSSPSSPEGATATSTASADAHHIAAETTRQLQTRLLGLMQHLVEQRIWAARHDKTKTKGAAAAGPTATTPEGTGGGPENLILANSLHPAKRMDGVMACLGEIIKFHPRNMWLFNEYLKMRAGDVLHVTAADYKYDGAAQTDAPMNVPLDFTIGLPSPVDTGRYARRQDDTLGTLLRRRLVTYSSDCNLFLRLITVSMMTGVAYPANYARKPYDTFTVSAAGSAAGTEGEKGITAAGVGAAAVAGGNTSSSGTGTGSPAFYSVASPSPSPCNSVSGRKRPARQFLDPYEDILSSIIVNEKRTLESTGLLVSRLYFVRQVGRQFAQQLLAHLHINKLKGRLLGVGAKGEEGEEGPLAEEAALARAKFLFSGAQTAAEDAAADSLNPANWIAEYLSWLGVHSPTSFDTKGFTTPIVGYGGFASETLRVTAVPSHHQSAVAADGSNTNKEVIAFNTSRPMSMLNGDSLEYAFGTAIRPAHLAEGAGVIVSGNSKSNTGAAAAMAAVTSAAGQKLDAYLNLVREKVFPDIANLPSEHCSARHAQQRRVARMLPTADAPNGATFLYHLPPSYFIPRPDRCVYPVIFQEDYAFVQQMPTGATFHPLLRGGALPTTADKTDKTKAFVSFSFPRAPIAGVQDKDNAYVKRYAPLLNTAFAHNVAHSGWIREHCGQVEKDLLHDPAILAFSMLKSAAIKPDKMEGTEKLCLITSSLLLFMREHWLDSEKGVENMLIRLRQLAYASKVKADAKKREEKRKYQEQMEALQKQREAGNAGPEQAVTPSALLAASGAFSSELQARATVTTYQNPFVKNAHAEEDDDDNDNANDALSAAPTAAKKSVAAAGTAPAVTVAAAPRDRYVAPTLSNNDVYYHDGAKDNGEEVVVSNGTAGDEEEDAADNGTGQEVTSAAELIYCIREFGTVGHVSNITAFQKSTQNADFFVQFFRILSVWISHYCSAQRYLETIYVCSHVPFAEWKVVALDVLRRLPYYFEDVQQYAME